MRWGNVMTARNRSRGSLRQLAALSTLALSLAGCSTLGELLADPAAAEHGPPTAGPAGDFETSMTHGKASFAAGNYGIALGQFQQALLVKPDSVRALNAIAATYDQLRNFTAADQYYMRAFRLAPSSPDLLNNVGYSHVLRGDTAGAQSYFALAKSLDPGNQVLAANLRLAQPTQPVAVTGQPSETAPTVPPAAPPTPPLPPFGEVHRGPTPVASVPLFGETHFVRVAPGVQMLVTHPIPPEPSTGLANAPQAPSPSMAVSDAGGRQPVAAAGSPIPPPPSRPPELVALAAAPPEVPSPPKFKTQPNPPVNSVGGGSPSSFPAGAASPPSASFPLESAPASHPASPPSTMPASVPSPQVAVATAPVLSLPAPQARSPAQADDAATKAAFSSDTWVMPVGAAWLLPAPPTVMSAAAPLPPAPDNGAAWRGRLLFVNGVYKGEAPMRPAQPDGAPQAPAASHGVVN